MNAYFRIDFKKRNGILHVHPRGDFDGNSAWELVNLLDAQYDGAQEVVIDTRQLKAVCAFGCRMFQYQLKLSRVPARSIIFEGAKGYEMAPGESRVVLPPEKDGCGCGGDCTNCPCASDKHHTDAMPGGTRHA